MSPLDSSPIIFYGGWDQRRKSTSPTCKLGTKNTAKRNMSSAVCALSIYSRLYMKMLSFLFVRTWAICVYYVYHVEFHFQFIHLVSYQLWCGCQGEKSSRKISGNFLRQKIFLEGRTNVLGCLHF